MKTVLALLLLCLCDRGQTDCQTDCLACLHILPRQLDFNPMVCLVECEGNISPAFTWDLCRKATSLPFSSVSIGGVMLKRAQEEVEGLLPEEEVALQRFDHVSRALGAGDTDLLNAAYNSQNAMSLEEEEEDEPGQEDKDMGGREVSKRFGGFLKGRHGYKKLVSPGRSYQKRYGGFIGVRKSARKWNNQKRVGEFLKQYLGMSTRATEFNSVSEDLTRQNEV